MADDRRVLVVGAGITGLAAAVDLVDAGLGVEVWDADDRVGGKIATSPFAGLEPVDEAGGPIRSIVDGISSLFRGQDDG